MTEATSVPTLGRLAVIGAGKMGTTLLRAMLDAGLVTAEEVIATALHDERLDLVHSELGVAVSRNNREAVRQADTVLFCVKPQSAERVLAELGDLLHPGQLLVSILAGVTTSRIEAQLDAEVPVVRAMPNTPALVGAGMTALTAGRHATSEQVNRARAVFDRLGRTVVLDEKHFDAVTGLGASGPAFVYIIIEALAEGGVKVGLPRAVATELAAQACLGAAQMVIETGDHPAVLKDAVTTPAGCTIDGILKLEEGGLRVTLIKTIVEASQRAGELVE